MKNLKKKTIRNRLREIVKKMHEAGYAHGDMNLQHFGYSKEEDRFYILQHDTVFKISSGVEPWLKAWMREGFDWDSDENTIESFVENDLEIWENDWICGAIPIATPVCACHSEKN